MGIEDEGPTLALAERRSPLQEAYGSLYNLFRLEEGGPTWAPVGTCSRRESEQIGAVRIQEFLKAIAEDGPAACSGEEIKALQRACINSRARASFYPLVLEILARFASFLLLIAYEFGHRSTHIHAVPSSRQWPRRCRQSIL